MQVTKELLELVKETTEADNSRQERRRTGLSDKEIVFYDALAGNESTVETSGRFNHK